MKQRLVIKIGTSTILRLADKNNIGLAREINELSDQFDIALVTSGAIGFGLGAINRTERPESIEELQALSSIGQAGLMNYWQHAFGDRTIGQLLITNKELSDPTTVLPFLETISEIWKIGAVPIINENDAIANEEIAFGDNDKLAAALAVCINADHLVILTDQDGIVANFGTVNAKTISTLTVQEAHHYLVDQKSPLGSGGMLSKLIAAEMVRQHGINMHVANGSRIDVIHKTLSGRTGTKLV